MGLVDSGVRRVDDHEHLGGEIGALAIEQHTGNFDPVDLLGVLLPEKVERRQAMLAIDNQITPLRLAQKPDTLGTLGAPEAERLISKQQDRSGNQRLAYGGLVEVDDLADLAAIEQTLKGFL